MKDFSYILAIRLMQQEFEGFADYFLASYIKLHTRSYTQSHYPPFYSHFTILVASLTAHDCALLENN